MVALVEGFLNTLQIKLLTSVKMWNTIITVPVNICLCLLVLLRLYNLRIWTVSLEA